MAGLSVESVVDPERSFESAVVLHSLDPINHRQNFGNDRIVMAQRLFRD